MPQPTLPPWLRNLLAAVLAIALSATLIITITDADGPGGAPPTIEVKITRVDATGDGVRDAPLIVPASAAEALEKSLPKSELSEPLREPGDTGPVGVLDGPLAASSLDGCRTRFVGNYSQRGVPLSAVGAIVMHQTVSRERGWPSQNALTAYSNVRVNGVSWHVLIGPTNGLCTYSVPLNMKAWTQGNANPVAVGIEVERYGDERSYVEGKGLAKTVSVLRQVGEQFDIPMRRGKVTFDEKCRPTVVRRGIVEHSDLGRCGGGHADVKPWSISPLIAAAAAKPPTVKYLASSYNLRVLTAEERRQAKGLLARRRVAQRGGGWSKVAGAHRRAAARHKAWLLERRRWLSSRLSSTANRAERYRVIGDVVAVR